MSLFVAGLLVVIGVQASITLGPALKPQRLEHAHFPVNDRSTQSIRALPSASAADRSRRVSSLGVHDFVYAFLSAPALITDYIQPQIVERDEPLAGQPASGIKTASPRGPPTTPP